MLLDDSVAEEQVDDMAMSTHQTPVQESVPVVISLSTIPFPASVNDRTTERVTREYTRIGEFEDWTHDVRLSSLIKFLKRTLDLLIVLIGLPIYLPIMFLSSLAIRLESYGPTIFRQERIGIGGKRFKITKFRSMRIERDCNQPKFACDEEERITRVGWFLRKFHIDELPQLWNVLRGDMSLVGPRPEQPEFVQEFNRVIPYYKYRHIVKPGITGLAQIKRGYTSDIRGTREKLCLDLDYISHLSLGLDVKILFQTFIAIIAQTDNGHNYNSEPAPAIERKGIYINLCPDHRRSKPIQRSKWNKPTAS